VFHYPSISVASVSALPIEIQFLDPDHPSNSLGE
jgi:hypothetical protein